MSDREHHCPFLNRADHRCSAHFSIEGLQHAFEHCFHAYKSCHVYGQLLLERQSRRTQAAASAVSAGKFLWATACMTPERNVQPTITTQLVQVRIPRLAPAGAGAAEYAKPAA